MEKILYEGIFLDPNDVHAIAGMYGKRLKNISVHPHITTSHHPIYTMDEHYGAECDVIITAYGRNRKSEGFKAIAVSGNDVVNAIIGRVKDPYITISVSDDADDNDTADLITSRKMKSCNPIVKLRGTFGALTTSGFIIEGGGNQ